MLAIAVAASRCGGGPGPVVATRPDDSLTLADRRRIVSAMDAFVRPSAKPATTAPAAAPPAVAPSDPDAQVLADYAKLKASGSSARLAVFMQQHGAALARAQARSKGASNN